MDVDDGKTVDTNFLADVEQVSTLLNCFHFVTDAAAK
jgi:hypothetical protein